MFSSHTYNTLLTIGVLKIQITGGGSCITTSSKLKCHFLNRISLLGLALTSNSLLNAFKYDTLMFSYGNMVHHISNSAKNQQIHSVKFQISMQRYEHHVFALFSFYESLHLLLKWGSALCESCLAAYEPQRKLTILKNFKYLIWQVGSKVYI